ncbi:uncharacterized protein LOC143151373 isoform X3 [Ptiloglossa arizonensis]|uniref:uncharacterized protein LOC143151373 isoform X3 n=1 Tax=Ptiloglossa arizonensis TaxID=3350558 RepID=UPI003F9F0509
MQLWKFQVTIVLKSNNLCKHVTKRSRREDTDEAWERKVVNSRKVEYRKTLPNGIVKQ